MHPYERKTLDALIALTPLLKDTTFCAWCGTPSPDLQPVSETIFDKLCPGCLYCYTHGAYRYDPPDAS